MRCDVYVKCIVFEKLWAKSDKYKFVGYLKEIIGYYLYHFFKQKCLSQICYLSIKKNFLKWVIKGK